MDLNEIKITKSELEEVIQTAIYKTDLFQLEVKHAGEIRFGPAYYTVRVFSKGIEIWNGQSNVYGEESFSRNVIAEKFNKLILIKWLSTTDPHEQVVVEVDLATGCEKKLVEHQRYWEAGHFNSFDGVYYRKSEIRDYLCKDLGTKADFLLYERIKEKIKAAFQWGVTSITNTIVVFTRERKNNVVLYNIRKKEVVDYSTIDFHPSERGSIRSYLNKSTGELTVNCHDFDLDSENRTINSTIKYYKIHF